MKVFASILKKGNAKYTQETSKCRWKVILKTRNLVWVYLKDGDFKLEHTTSSNKRRLVWARLIKDNAFGVELLMGMYTSNVFNIADLTPYKAMETEDTTTTIGRHWVYSPEYRPTICSHSSYQYISPLTKVSSSVKWMRLSGALHESPKMVRIRLILCEHDSYNYWGTTFINRSINLHANHSIFKKSSQP